jgi:hypothetical protein
MTFFKSLRLLALFALFCENSQAQFGGLGGSYLSTVISGGTNNVATVATNTYAAVLAPVRSEWMAVMVKYTFVAAPVGVTPTVTLRFARANDASNYENISSLPISLSSQGATNTCIYFTNVVVQGVPYFKLTSIENTNSTAITNLTVSYSVKR